MFLPFAVKVGRKSPSLISGSKLAKRRHFESFRYATFLVLNLLQCGFLLLDYVGNGLRNDFHWISTCIGGVFLILLPALEL